MPLYTVPAFRHIGGWVNGTDKKWQVGLELETVANYTTHVKVDALIKWAMTSLIVIILYYMATLTDWHAIQRIKNLALSYHDKRIAFAHELKHIILKIKLLIPLFWKILTRKPFVIFQKGSNYEWRPFYPVYVIHIFSPMSIPSVGFWFWWKCTGTFKTIPIFKGWLYLSSFSHKINLICNNKSPRK